MELLTRIYNMIFGKKKKVPVVGITYRDDDIMGFAESKKLMMINIEDIIKEKDYHFKHNQVSFVFLQSFFLN